MQRSVTRVVHPSSGSLSGSNGALHADARPPRRSAASARAAQAETDATWEAHLGARRTHALREALEALRESVDPWA